MSQIKPQVLVVEEVEALQHVLVEALRRGGVMARGVARCDEVKAFGATGLGRTTLDKQEAFLAAG